MPPEKRSALYKIRNEQARLNESLGRPLYSTEDLKDPDELFRIQMKQDFARLYIKNDYNMRATSEQMGISSSKLDRWLATDTMRNLIKEMERENKEKDKEERMKTGISLADIVRDSELLKKEIAETPTTMLVQNVDGTETVVEGLTIKERFSRRESMIRFQADMYNKFSDELTNELDKVSKMGGKEPVELYIAIGKRLFETKFLKNIFRDLLRNELKGTVNE